jgi:uroporphyrinogen III methyltransferase / synthase
MADPKADPSTAELPLTGVTIVVTRPNSQGKALASALSIRGALAVCIPTITIADPDDFAPIDRAIGALETYDWLIFTSRNGVERFLDRVESRGRRSMLGGLRVAAVGPATAASLTSRNLDVSVVPENFVAEGLFDALSAADSLIGARVLLPRAAIARDALPDALRAAGAIVDIVDLYQTKVAETSREPLVALVESRGIDFAVFTSSSTAKSFVELVGIDRARKTRAICTGPVVASTARELGLPVALELPAYSVDAIVSGTERLVADGGISSR